MKRVASIQEVVSVFRKTGEADAEVCATAEAGYEEAAGELVVELNGFLRPVDLLHPEKHLHPDWLPPRSIVREKAPLEDCRPLVQEIFQHWVKRLRTIVPATT